MKHLIHALHALLALACALPFAGTSMAGQDDAPTAEERFDALEEEVSEAYAAWRKELDELRKQARETGEKLPSSAWTPPYAAFIPRFQDAASEFAGSEDAVRFLCWIANLGMGVDEKAGKAALSTLVNSHPKSEGLSAIASSLPEFQSIFGAQEGIKMLIKLEQESPVANVRAWIVYTRLVYTLTNAELDSDVYAAAKREMLAALEKASDRNLSSEVSSTIDVREKFSIGMVAPDIVGIDLDGTSFKLSDYRGQVLFVDFWGDW